MRTLRLNASGDDVKDWQAFLTNAGLYDGKVDGKFGPRTLEATKAFQRANALNDDGFVGNRTLGVAMQHGLSLVPDDSPLANGGQGGVAFINDAWVAPPPPNTDENIFSRDPRMIVDHAPGALPCPPNPPAPVGWTYWKGQVPAMLGKLAEKVQSNSAEFPMGAFVQALIEGHLVAARVEWHDYQGVTGRHGCFRGTSLFRPRA